MADQPADSESQMTARLLALSEAYAWAEAEVTDIPDPQRAFEAATRLGELIRIFVDDAGALRAQQAYRIYTAKGLTLTGLADQISVSKARADQLVRRGRKASTEPPTPEGTPP